jgi:hypothetical protein
LRNLFQLIAVRFAAPIFGLLAIFKPFTVLSCSFAFMQKNQKIKANAKLRRFAVPRLPECNNASFIFWLVT